MRIKSHNLMPSTSTAPCVLPSSSIEYISSILLSKGNLQVVENRPHLIFEEDFLNHTYIYVVHPKSDLYNFLLYCFFELARHIVFQETAPQLFACLSIVG